MSKDMDELRGMALATRAEALAEQAERQPRPVVPVIPGKTLAGAAPGGRIRSAVTDAGRARCGLFGHMLRHMKSGTMEKLKPEQREALEWLKKLDGGR